MLVYFVAIWNILRPFGIFYGHWVYFGTKLSPFLYKKNLATLLGPEKRDIVEQAQAGERHIFIYNGCTHRKRK
jgi:hypothetical protein